MSEIDIDSSNALAPEKTVKLLKAARGLIENGWTQGAYARDEFGFKCEYEMDRACQFCISGAIIRASNDLALTPNQLQIVVNQIMPKLLTIAKTIAGAESANLTGWNDAANRTKKHVLQTLDQTIGSQHENAKRDLP